MSEVGRNDPCPCGSGKKYKKCCLDPGSAAASGVSTFVSPPVRRAASAAASWQADVVPIPGTLQDDPGARLGAAMVTAGGFILACEVQGRAPAEPGDVARVLEAAVRSSADAVRGWPRTVEVRHHEVAEALTESLGREKVRVVRRRSLPELDEFAARMAGDLADWEGGRPYAAPETWAGWGLPGATVAELFRAAASFWRAAPWVRLPNERSLLARLPEGREWTVGVLGNGGQEFGLTLCARPEDFAQLVTGSPLHEIVEVLEDRLLALLFAGRGELPRRMQREIASVGWEVAGPEAYPTLIPLNSPGGGVRRRDAEDLAAVLRAVAGLARASPEALSRGERAEWRDPETGAYVLHEEADDEWSIPPLWELPSELPPGGPEGPAARPEAALDVLWIADAEELEAFAGELREAADPFGSWLREVRGLAEATAQRHRENLETFLSFLAMDQGVPLEALMEYDLRCFLYDWYPRKVLDAAYRAKAMPASLRHFFHWLREEREIRCSWAARVLGEREAYTTRQVEFPGGFWWDEDVRAWQAEAWKDLDARVMLHDPGLGTTSRWGREGPLGLTMGSVEADLDRELGRRWLLWREEEIRDGPTDPDQVRAALLRRQRDWEGSPHPRLDGRTPEEAIRRERAES